MLCENCKHNEANVMYSENINGVKREMHLCEECSHKLGITNKMNFRMPAMDLSGFFGLESSFKNLFDDFNGFENFGLLDSFAEPQEYTNIFEDGMSSTLKQLQESNNKKDRVRPAKEENKKEDLQTELEKAIKEERYEDAAKIRDQIKKEE